MLTKDYTAKLLNLEAYAGNGCAKSPTFEAAQKGKNIHCTAADVLFRGFLSSHDKNRQAHRLLPA